MESKGCSTKSNPNVMPDTEIIMLSKSPHNFFQNKDSSESSEDEAEDIMKKDAALGGLRKGIQSITTHARSTLAKCDTGEIITQSHFFHENIARLYNLSEVAGSSSCLFDTANKNSPKLWNA